MKQSIQADLMEGGARLLQLLKDIEAGATPSELDAAAVSERRCLDRTVGQSSARHRSFRRAATMIRSKIWSRTASILQK
ncbi:hypothetical protein ACVME8_000440 [Bradyrhizobium diazoefficiens]